MIDIYRFSEDGFTPKLQSNIIQDILFWREYTGLDTIPKFQIKHFEKTIEKAKDMDINEIKYSIFSFIGKPDNRLSNFLLNHLSYKEKSKRRWYKGKISKQSIVYADSDILGKIEHLDKFVLSDLLKLFPYYDSVIIPKLSADLITDIECVG